MVSEWPAPAKLNLMLRVTGRRADGYHELQTVFQFIDLLDRLRIRVRGDGEIRRLTPVAGVPEQSDLIVRAARLLQTESGGGLGADIEIEKQIPQGGGLGGGSSDAATTLVALNRLWGLGWSNERLMALGLSLGADVPVFIGGRAAWAEGVGERLQPIDLPEPWYCVLRPACHVSTAEVFGDPDLTRDSGKITIRDFLAGTGGNDTQAVVEHRYPRVAEALAHLGQFGVAKLTGTGACIFAEFADQAAAARPLQGLPAGCEGWAVKGRNRSPLRDTAA